MGAIDALMLQARLLWDGDAADRGMASAGQQADKLESKFSKAFKTIGTAMAAAFTVDKIVGFGKECVQAGAEVDAEMSAFGQTMGDYADEASTKVQGIADATGMVSTRLTPYMTSMTAKFKGLGYGVEDATDMAARGLNLAADGAAFWDMSMNESSSHLNSFINGSYEGGEAIGLFANDTQMAAFAVQQGLVKSTKEWANLDEATKQATRLEYAENMYEQSGATGQAAKESKQYANVMANLSEKWRQFQARIGTPLIQNVVIPAVDLLSKGLDALSVAVEYVKEHFGDWMEAAKGLVPWLEAAVGVYATFKVGTAIQGIVQGFQKAKVAVSLFTLAQGESGIATGIATGALKLHEIAVGLLTGKITLAQVATGIWTKVQAGLNAVMSANPIALVVVALTAIVAALVLAYQKSETFRAFVDQLWTALKDRLQPVIQSVSDFFTGTLVPALQSAGDFIVTTVVPVLQELWSWLQDKILYVIQSVAGWITSTLIPTLQSWADYVMNVIVPALMGLWTAIQEWVQPILQAIVDFIQNTVVPAFMKIVEVTADVMAQAAPILEAIKTAVSTAFEACKIIVETVWGVIKTVVSTELQVIKGIIDTVTALIKGDWSGAWEAIKGVAMTVWEGIKTVISTVFSGIWSFIVTTLSGIMGYWSSVWEAIKGVAVAVWNNIKGTVTGVFNAVKGFITTTLTGIKTFWTTAWNGIKTTASTIWNGIKTTVSTAFNAVKTTVSTILGGIKTFWTTAWNGIKTTIMTVWNGIKTTITTKFDAIKTTVSSAVDKVKEWLSFSGLVDKVKGIFEDVKNGIKGKIEDARDLVKGIVDSIVGFFTGAKFTWPKIPMPHFGISPKGWSAGDLLRGSIPKLSIDWYAKAMDNAMVLDGASIFGAADGNLLGGGEAGREVVSGEAHLIDLIGRAVAQNNAAMLDVLRRILSAILDMDESMYNTIVDALTDGVKFDIDGRQFGRLVRTYA